MAAGRKPKAKAAAHGSRASKSEPRSPSENGRSGKQRKSDKCIQSKPRRNSPDRCAIPIRRTVHRFGTDMVTSIPSQLCCTVAGRSFLSCAVWHVVSGQEFARGPAYSLLSGRRR